MNTNAKFEATEIPVTPDVTVQGVVGTPEWWPSGQRVGIVLGHAEDGSIEQESLIDLQRALTESDYLTLRFNFPYAAVGRKRPDAPAPLERTFKAAIASLLTDRETAPARLVIGGYGLGARVAASVVSQGFKVDGVICLGFPLHPSGKPNQQKADALFRIICPILFVQGVRDTHCRIDRLEDLLRRIGAPTQIRVIEDAGQGLNLIKRTARTAQEIHLEVLGAVQGFVQKVSGG